MMQQDDYPQYVKVFWRGFLAVFVFLASMMNAASADAASVRKIDVSVDVALERFYKDVKGAREFSRAAKGLLVLPGVKKAAFVFGGEYGEGALRIGGKTVDYYNTVSASFGLQIGAQAKDFIIAFMTDEALRKFRKSEGWEAGV